MSETTNAPEKAINVKLPKKKYKIRCVIAEYGESQKGNAMVTRDWEIISPETVGITQADGSIKTYTTAGLIIRGDRLTKTDKTKKWLEDDERRTGVAFPNPESPNAKLYEGVICQAIIISEASPQIDEETKEPITDDNGQPIVRYYNKIQEWI